MTRHAGADAPPPPADNVFLAVPHYGALEPESLPGLMLASQSRRYTVRLNCASLLAHNFNRLLCDALNERRAEGYTHFAMMHADQGPPPGWLDTLIAEMERVNADVISVAVAIKDGRGLTSTGMRDPRTGDIRRLTTTELHRLPETFAASALGDGELMVNTGLWAARFDDWWEDFPGFTITDAIVKEPDGTFRAGVMPEDWAFSQWCHNRGLRVFATRAVPVVHYGRSGFANDRPWGEWLTDKGDRALRG